MSNLKAYLAEKYMSGPKADAILSKVAPQKKKKRKAGATASASIGARIVDEDSGWVEQRQEEPEDLEDAVIEKDRGFKKRKTDQQAVEDSGGWAVVQEGIKQEEEQELEDEKPVVVETEDSNAFVGGLVTAKDLKRVLNREPKGRKNSPREGSEEEVAQMQETVYRDPSGRRIDTKAEKAETARLKREREEKEAKKMEWGKGLVQKEEAEEKKRELKKQKTTAFTRHADDKELNEDLKARELWNDPAAAFLSKKRSKGPRKPEYTGPPPPPNRFGIKPGYRWDGVDRSNGFEKKLFQSINNRTRQTTEYHAWSVDDM